ncbi:MAG: hypothetical protein IKC03_00825 [Oscillospiraceae bacterium]|nr:hypothetical protein [Oscillospiraceae bacterium]
MKRMIPLLICVLLLTACSSGGSIQTDPSKIKSFELSETFHTLLDRVNEEHEAVKLYSDDYSAYTTQYKNPDFDPAVCEPNVKAMPKSEAVLPLEQIKADMEIFYEALRTQYGCYAYFGGDEVFRSAIDAVIADCAAMDEIRCGDWVESMMTHLSFINDAHFTVGNLQLGEAEVPFFFRSVSFQKTEDGYVTDNGKTVASIDGYDDLDELFKLSLTQKGELVYYPVLLEKFHYTKLDGKKVECSTTLTVRYADGSYDELKAEPFKLTDRSSSSKNVTTKEKNGIPVVTVNQFNPKKDGTLYTDSAPLLRDRDIFIMDMRTCTGGQFKMMPQWFTNYTMQEVWQNALSLTKGTPDMLYKNHLSKSDKEFVSAENVCIVLTSKRTMSCGEAFVDMSYNMENTLLVGENTFGCATSSLKQWTLPNTGLFVQFGELLYLYPGNDYFEEYRGFYPSSGYLLLKPRKL